MSDSSYEEDDDPHHDESHAQHQHSQHAHHTHSHSAFTQRFGSIKKQFPFKKGMSQRERITSTEEEAAFGHEKSASFGSMLKNRFQGASFVNRIRAQSEVLNGATTTSPTNQQQQQQQLPSLYSPHHSASGHSASSALASLSSPKGMHANVGQIHRERRNSVKSSSSGKKYKKKHKKKHHGDGDVDSSKDRAFSVLLNENRALKNEIEVYKRSLDAISVEKEHLESNYDELKSNVSDVTTQLRIMTKRYNKLKNKNEEYKKHFQNTLTIRLSAQQQTITNQHAQLMNMKEKYDILYSEYLDKNNIIKDWEAKYHRLAADFDEFMQGHHEHNDDDNSAAPSATELVSNIKQLKRIIIEKDENLYFLSQIISNMYHNSLPIIQTHIEKEEGDDDDDDDQKTESTDSDSSHQHNRNRNHHHHHHRRIHHEDEDSEEEEDEDDDDDDEISHLEEDNIATMKASIYNIDNDENQSQNQLQIASKLQQLQIPKNKNKLNDRSLSGISVDDDGIDKHDDDDDDRDDDDDDGSEQQVISLSKPKSVGIIAIELPKLNKSGAIKPNKLMKLASKTPTVSHSGPILKKKRRRSWVMEGGNGAIVITTIDGKQRITNKTTVNVAVADEKNQDKKAIQSPSKSTSSTSSSSSSSSTTTSDTVAVAPSPAPPPPNPSTVLLQTPQQTPQQSTTPPAVNDIRNNISDQLSASTEPSQSPQNKHVMHHHHHHHHQYHNTDNMQHHAITNYSNGDNDDEDDDEEEEEENHHHLHHAEEL